ncbi:hypothetical protein PMAYCL1PPCAC_08594 [Pristionchus mayeri]|uniref:SXP/RAL-2 family protein Ani s 5-like cation-binding domain-containing protein n=1 Tax=Pristionchus mayeri TaxID=1317129 RepID=A0AAN4ZF49_9BILA|nr:hypothetical protein PMAYCL1PPCAC_08594 [Pristionchus mayeri]
MLARLSLLALVAVAIYAQGPNDYPPFLQNADAGSRASFVAVINANKNKPEPQVNAAVDKWAAGQSGAVQTAYAKFKAEIAKHQKAEAAAHAAAVARFSLGAKKADADLNAVSAQAGLSFEAKQKKINDIMNKLDPAVRQELIAAMGGPQQ